MEADGTNLQPMRYTGVDLPAKFFCLTWLGEGFISYTIEKDTGRRVRVVDISTGDTWPLEVAGMNDGFDRSCPLWPMLVKNPWIVLVSNRNGQDEIYKYDPDRQKEEQVTFDSSGSLGITRSANEEWIAFYSHRTGNWDIFLARTFGVATGNQWNITNNPADDIQPAWEPY